MTEQTAILEPATSGEISQPVDATLARHGVLACAFGLLTGSAAGLIGVGGGEFRMPLLIYLFRNHVKTAAGVNLVVGLFTVCLSLVRRWGQHDWSGEDIVVTVAFAVPSLFGAVLGVRQAHRLSYPILRKVVCGYLLVVGVWMIFEGVSYSEYIIWNPSGLPRLLLAACLGFLIAAISGALGVAGGEMRIPVLLYLFAVPIKVAGTLSLIVSIPTVAAGAVTYRRFGHVPNHVLLVAVLMGLGSLAGVFLGTSLLPHVDKHTLKAVLGILLLLATVGVAVPLFRGGAHSRSA
ncbi:MAG: hypothetical protein A2W31_13845 [Planctomycetes bacterium RBG_16_64_10]|nr:MAG: hypothetical protein A2W31_13845 [Planctomycetes bacterium RBG_16_64_10]